MKISTTCCGLAAPVGVTEPQFSWKVTDCSDPKALGYRICVYDSTDALLWDSGRVDSEETQRILYAGAPLCDNTLYFWTVTVFTEKECQTSPAARFVTGILHPEQLPWISPDDKEMASPLLWKEIDVETVAEDAVVNICGLGFFELYINGQKVGDEWMSPARTDYDTITYHDLSYPFLWETKKRTLLCSYEVSAYLRPGKNRIMVWLGNGWYRQWYHEIGRKIEGFFDYGGELKMFFRLTNGEQIVDSDETWCVADSNILENNIFYGETIDGRIRPDFSDTSRRAHFATPPAGKILPQLCPPERVRRTLSLLPLQGGIYDAGECLTGVAELLCRGNAGDRVTLTFGEKLDAEGNLDVTSTVGYCSWDDHQIQKDEFILSGEGEERFCPRFTWHAFRYVQIDCPASVEILEGKAQEICTDLNDRGSFSCSDDLLNTLYHVCKNTQRSNTHGCVPMDCPHRERLGYTGDGQISSRSVMTLLEAEGFYRKWIGDIVDTQSPTTGFVTHTAPFHGGGGGHAWGSAIAVVPWNFYLQYGDKELLRSLREPIRKWIGYLADHTEEGLVTHEEPGSWCLGDWVMPSKYPWSAPHPDAIRIPPALVNTAFYIRCMDIYLKICALLEIVPEEEIVQARSLSVDALNRTFLAEQYADGEQGSDLFPLFLDIVPKEAEARVLEHLVADIEERGYCFNTGLMGTGWLPEVLHRYGRDDVTLKMYRNDQYPSFGYMLKEGATALWETWEGTGAQNHTAFSSMGSWFFFGLAGIEPNETKGGYREFTVRPYFAPELEHLDVTMECPYGTIEEHWRREGDDILLQISVPFHTTATLILPDETKVLTAGRYEFRL